MTTRSYIPTSLSHKDQRSQSVSHSSQNGARLSDREQVKDVPRSQFDVVVALYDIDVEFPLGRGDEDSLIDFELRMDVRKATCWISKKSRM